MNDAPAARLPPRVNIVTLGVRDVVRSAEFYGALGFPRIDWPNPSIAFFDLGPLMLSVFPLSDLMAEAKPSQAPAGPRHTLAINLADEAAVDAALVCAKAAGATITRPAAKTGWGGYSAYFEDPDRHLWELAYNPFATLTSDGRLVFAGSENET